MSVFRQWCWSPVNRVLLNVYFRPVSEGNSNSSTSECGSFVNQARLVWHCQCVVSMIIHSHHFEMSVHIILQKLPVHVSYCWKWPTFWKKIISELFKLFLHSLHSYNRDLIKYAIHNVYVTYTYKWANCILYSYTPV